MDYYDLGPRSGVSSVLSNEQFLYSSSLATKSASATTNIDYIHSHDRSWYYDSSADRLYVNPSNPANLGGMEAVTRPIGVEIGGSQHVVVRDIAVDNTAAANNSYSVNVVNSEHVTLDSITAYRGGKHHFAAIDSGDFVGRNLTAKQVMPQLGYGGASSFVSYSHGNRGTNQDSTWINVISDLSGSNMQPAFYDHGGGLGTVKVIGMQGINSRFASTSSGLILRDSIFDGSVVISGNGSLVEGLQLIGSRGPLRINGNNVVVENLMVDNTSLMNNSYGAAIVVNGANASLRFLTVDAKTMGGGAYSMLALLSGGTNLEIIGSVFTHPGTHAIISSLFGGDAWKSMSLKWNVFGDGRFLYTGQRKFFTLAEIKAMGLDQSSTEVAAFPYTIGPDGLYHLDPGSDLVGFVPMDDIGFDLLNGVYGKNRSQSGFYDAGAVTIPANVPEPASLLLAAAAIGGLAVARRRRRSNSQTDRYL